MKIYKYPYSKSHTRNDTDSFISEAVKKYAEAEGILPTGGLFVKRTPLGKPFAEGYKGVYISVTHADEILLVAVSECEIGIDCESKSRKTRDMNALAGRFFTPAEKERFAGVNPDGREIFFLETWTKKEALVKLSGEGLAAITRTDSQNPPPGVSLTVIDDYPGYVVSAAEKNAVSEVRNNNG